MPEINYTGNQAKDFMNSPEGVRFVERIRKLGFTDRYINLMVTERFFANRSCLSDYEIELWKTGLGEDFVLVEDKYFSSAALS